VDSTDPSQSTQNKARFRRLSQTTTDDSTPCSLPLDSQFTDTLSLGSTFLKSDMIYEFTVTVTSASSGTCDRDRSATERRVIKTQTDPLPKMEIEICKDPKCRKRIHLERGVGTVNANRRSPNLYMKLGVQSECPAGVDVIWTTSMERVHLATKNLLDEHTLNRLGQETLKISFNYIYPPDAEYAFSITATCSSRSTSTSTVGLGIVMNYGPSGGKMEVRTGVVAATVCLILTETFFHK